MSSLVRPRMLLLASASALLIAADGLAQAQCTPLAVYKPDQIARGRSASVRVLQGVPTTNYRDEPDALIEGLLEQRAIKELVSSRYFSSVSPLSPQGASKADLNFELGFSAVVAGLRELPFLPARPTIVVFHGRITAREGEPVLDFFCLSQTRTGILKRPKKWVHEGIDRAASKLKELMPRLERDLNRDRASTRGPITAAPSDVGNWWMLASPDDWQRPRKPRHWWPPQSASINTFRVGSLAPVDPAGTVFAAFVSTRDLDFLTGSFQRITRLGPGLVPGPPGEAFAHEVASEVNRESYLLLLWFVKKGSPRWDINAIAAKTSFITPRRFNDPILPVRGASSRPYVPSQAVRHGWTYNVAMFVFPATRVDGTPVLAGLSDQVEVRTEIDGRAVVLRFDPSRSGLDSIDRLTRRR